MTRDWTPTDAADAADADRDRKWWRRPTFDECFGLRDDGEPDSICPDCSEPVADPGLCDECVRLNGAPA